METGYTYVIGMDMGTTNIKAIALHRNGYGNDKYKGNRAPL